MFFKRFLFYFLCSFPLFVYFPRLILPRLCPYKCRYNCPIWSCPCHFSDNKYTFECYYR